MRKVIALEFITLDGVMQTSGGWAGPSGPYANEVTRTVIRGQMNLPFDLLVGRTTFEEFASYWPHHADDWPGVNTATKYVASNTMTTHEWQPTVFFGGDIAEYVSNLKQQQGPDFHVFGSGNLMQTLLKHDLVDAFWLRIFPLTLGSGNRLFAAGTIPAAFKVTESTVSSTGVILVNYERAGAIQTGTIS